MKALRQRRMERCNGFGVIRDNENEQYNAGVTSSPPDIGTPDSLKSKSKRDARKSKQKHKQNVKKVKPIKIKSPLSKAVAMPVPGPPGKPLHKAIVNIGKGVDSAWAGPPQSRRRRSTRSKRANMSR